MKNKKKTQDPKKVKTKRIVISVIAVILVVALGCGLWYYYGHRNTDPVYVYNFYTVGMDQYWGDSQESYGPVTTDRLQTVFLTETQTVKEIYVQEGDTVRKGDPLMAFDTTLSDLALERKRLDLEKQKLRLGDEKKALQQIKAMVPIAYYNPPKPTEPTTPNQGTPLSGAYQVISKPSSNGSTEAKSLICWVSGDTTIDSTLFEALRLKAQSLQKGTGATPAAHTEDDPTEATETEPTETEPTETDPPVTEPPATEPPAPQVEKYYVVFKTTEGNMSKGQNVTWQGMYVTGTKDTGFSFKLFDASAVSDVVELPSAQEPDDDGPRVDYNSGYTAAEISRMRQEKEQEIKDLEFQIKMAETEYKIAQTEMTDGVVCAELDGTVGAILPPDEALRNQQPLMKVSGGGGYYIQCTVSELDKDNLQIGQEVTVNDWNSGMMYTGTVQSVGDYPADGNSGWGMGNPNVSYYPFTVFVDESADLQDGYYANVQYTANEQDAGIYLENPFIRTENGKSYVYVLGEDGCLEKRYVVTGKALWGSYTEILSGLTVEDKVAFPYGKNVREGAPAQEGDMSNLYGNFY